MGVRDVEYTIVLVDDTRVTVHASGDATAGQVCQVVAQKLNMVESTHFALFKPDGVTFLANHVLPLGHVVTGEKPVFIFKRLLYFENTNQTDDDQELHLLFIQAYDDVIRGRYRLTPDEITKLASLYLQARLGSSSRQLYDPGFVEAWLSDLVPRYAERERSVEDWAEDIRRAHVVLAREEKGFVERRYVGALSRLEYYGNELYDVEEVLDPDLVHTAREAVEAQDRVRPAVLGVGYRGLVVLTPGTLTIALEIPFSHLVSWHPSPSRLAIVVSDGIEIKRIEFNTTLSSAIVQLIEAYIVANDERASEVDTRIDTADRLRRLRARQGPSTRFGYEYLDDPYTFPGLGNDPIERRRAAPTIDEPKSYAHHPDQYEADLRAVKEQIYSDTKRIRDTLTQVREEVQDQRATLNRGHDVIKAHRSYKIRPESFRFDREISRPRDFHQYIPERSSRRPRSPRDRRDDDWLGRDQYRDHREQPARHPADDWLRQDGGRDRRVLRTSSMPGGHRRIGDNRDSRSFYRDRDYQRGGRDEREVKLSPVQIHAEDRPRDSDFEDERDNRDRDDWRGNGSRRPRSDGSRRREMSRLREYDDTRDRYRAMAHGRRMDDRDESGWAQSFSRQMSPESHHRHSRFDGYPEQSRNYPEYDYARDPRSAQDMGDDRFGTSYRPIDRRHTADIVTAEPGVYRSSGGIVTSSTSPPIRSSVAGSRVRLNSTIGVNPIPARSTGVYQYNSVPVNVTVGSARPLGEQDVVSGSPWRRAGGEVVTQNGSPSKEPLVVGNISSPAGTWGASQSKTNSNLANSTTRAQNNDQDPAASVVVVEQEGEIRDESRRSRAVTSATVIPASPLATASSQSQHRSASVSRRISSRESYSVLNRRGGPVRAFPLHQSSAIPSPIRNSPLPSVYGDSSIVGERDITMESIE